MKIVKIDTINYDPHSKLLSISGVNRFSKKKNNTVFIEDEAKFVEILHHLLANSGASSVNYVDGVQPESKGKKTRSVK